jgi:GntR family transcriptional repressor for pyruvate dehydrogenase complex
MTQSVSTHAVNVIQQWIRDGIYPAGTLLPSQRRLAEQLKISRASLREAISTLQGLGIVVAHPGKGVYVAEEAEPSAPPPWRFSETHSLIDTYQLRFALEGFTARLAAQAIQPDEIAALRDNAEAMRRAIEEDAYDTATVLDFEFHMGIVKIAGNRIIADILRGSAEVMRESQRLPFYRRGARHATFVEHSAILDALETGRPEAAQRAMQRHITQAAQRAGIHFPNGDSLVESALPESF